MKRTGLITVLAILQMLAGLSFAGIAIYLAIYLVAQTRNSGVLKPQEAAGAIYGYKVAALAVSIVAVPNFLAGIGLWRMKPWGRWLAVAINGFTLATLLYGPIFEHESMDLADILTASTFAALLILFLLPVVGRHLRGEQTAVKALPEAGA